jgi:hypothetical protein
MVALDGLGSYNPSSKKRGTVSFTFVEATKCLIGNPNFFDIICMIKTALYNNELIIQMLHAIY